MAYCCAQRVRTDTSSLAMSPASHIRVTPCFCMSPARGIRQTRCFTMFPMSCICQTLRFEMWCASRGTLRSAWSVLFWVCSVAGGFMTLALLVVLLPVCWPGLLSTFAQTPNPNGFCSPGLPNAPFCNDSSKAHPTNSAFYNTVREKHLPNIAFCNVACKLHLPSIAFCNASPEPH